jgi:enterochelin esterase-like enzyme
VRTSVLIALLLGWHPVLFAQSSPSSAPESSQALIHPIETSPVIGALKKHLEAGDVRAVDDFWRGADRSGTPFIERVSGDDQNVIVTFVWRGDRETRSVGLLAPLANAPGLPCLPLKRLLDTNVWYGSWEVRNDLRFTYRFSPNVKPGANPQQFATPDPSNRREMVIPFEGGNIPNTELSIASMPNAPIERWIEKQLNEAEGRLVLHKLNSKILASERTIWVYIPPGYYEKRPAPYRLLLLFDGFSYQHWIPAPTILDNLVHAQEIPPMVAVLIDNPPGTRSSDLEYNPKFVDFLADELVPWLREHYEVTRDPQKTIIRGYSDGGAAAAFAAMRRPDLFGSVLSESGSFWEGHDTAKWEFLATQYEASPRRAIRFFIDAGLLENVSKDGPSLLAANRHFVEVLRRKKYPVIYEEFGGTHEPVHWRDTLPDGLMSLAK